MFGEDLYEEEYAQVWKQFPLPQFSKTDVAAARSGTRRYFLQVAARSAVPRDAVAIEETSVRSRPGSEPVLVRIYRPKSHERGRGLIYLHGGGFTVGDLDIEDERCYLLARDAQCVVVSVDYRLAPEFTYPIPLEDCYTALQWIAENAGELAVHTDRVGVAGCSAGGALAAGLAQLTCDRGGPALAMQMLLYAVLDTTTSSATMSRLDEEMRCDLERMWDRYLGDLRPAPPSYATPGSRTNLSGLPPAYIVAAEFDIFRDQAVAYAEALRNDGVGAELHVWPRVPHAFDQFVPEATISRQAVKEQANAIIRFLG